MMLEPSVELASLVLTPSERGRMRGGRMMGGRESAGINRSGVANERVVRGRSSQSLGREPYADAR